MWQSLKVFRIFADNKTIDYYFMIDETEQEKEARLREEIKDAVSVMCFIAIVFLVIMAGALAIAGALQ